MGKCKITQIQTYWNWSVCCGENGGIVNNKSIAKLLHKRQCCINRSVRRWNCCSNRPAADVTASRHLAGLRATGTRVHACVLPLQTLWWATQTTLCWAPTQIQHAMLLTDEVCLLSIKSINPHYSSTHMPLWLSVTAKASCSVNFNRPLSNLGPNLQNILRFIARLS